QVQHAGWALFVVLFFAPDLSMLGYLVNPRIGAIAYNAAHTTIVYGPLAAYGYLSGVSVALAVGLSDWRMWASTASWATACSTHSALATHTLATREKRLTSIRFEYRPPNGPPSSP